MNRNYQKELEREIERLRAKGGARKRLLLHSCCAPCSSCVIERLSEWFQITVFYYNPNLYPDSEYEARKKEQIRFIQEFPAKNPVGFLSCGFEKERFYEAVRGHENEKEGGERCFRCYRLRLLKTAEEAARLGMDYFTTTLSISPLKNAAKLNEIGERLSAEYGVPYLVSDFKKKNGFLRSAELSREYGLYRQDYCGCIFSRQEREARRQLQNHGEGR